jgi:dihydroflavonol-4-reductase
MILVTGATGHIGNVLIRELANKGEKVRALVLPKDDLTPIMDLDIEIAIGDVLDRASIRRALRQVKTVYHLAGLISILPGDWAMLQKVNVEGTRNMLDMAREMNVRRFIYTSSIHALSRIPHGKTVDESVLFDAATRMGDYDKSKAMASLEVIKAAKEGLNAVIVCPTGVIGPFDYKGSEMGTLINNALTSKLVFSIDGAYDFVDVRDVVKGMILAGERGRTGEIYILSGQWIKIKELLNTVIQITGSKAPQIKIPTFIAKAFCKITPAFYRLTKSKPQFTPYSIETVHSNAIVSHSKATSELGYAPRSILLESLQDTVLWLLEYKRLKLVPIKK